MTDRLNSIRLVSELAKSKKRPAHLVSACRSMSPSLEIHTVATKRKRCLDKRTPDEQNNQILSSSTSATSLFMYFTSLPNHQKPGFDENSHFSKFKNHNIIFNAQSSYSHCDNHIGCLSFKTVLKGEEWYGINNHQAAVRPGQFLILNDNQNYSCRIKKGEKTRVLSIFFEKKFASAVFHDTIHSEEALLGNPFDSGEKTLEFFQTLNKISPEYELQLSNLIANLDSNGQDGSTINEHLIFLLRYLIHAHKMESNRARNVNALKASTKTEIYKRLCIAKDIIHSSFMDNPDLSTISNTACLSVPQLVRQFKNVFQATPHQYLIRVRINHAADLLRLTDKPIHEITWRCGFENVSAFCRMFKSKHGIQPGSFRMASR